MDSYSKAKVQCSSDRPHQDHTWLMYGAETPLVYYCKGVQGTLLTAEDCDILSADNVEAMACKYGYDPDELRNKLLSSDKVLILGFSLKETS